MQRQVPPSGFETSEHSKGRSVPVRWMFYGLLLFLLISFIFGLRIRATLREQTGQALQTTLRLNVAAVERWIDVVRSDVRRTTTANRAAIDAWFDATSVDGNDISMDTVCRPIGWVVLDEDRRVMQSDPPKLIGERLAIPVEAWNRLPQREPVIAWPFVCPIPLSNTGPLSSPEPVVMCVMMPVTDGARPLGCFGLLLDPMDEFSSHLSATRSGNTGESLAFDRDANLLTPSRFEDELRSRSLLADQRTSILAVSLRGDDGSLTMIADQATRGGSGLDVRGITDYRGQKVFAAWKWLPAYQIGIATKVDAAEAMSVWKWIWWGWLTALLLLAAGIAWIGWGTYPVKANRNLDAAPIRSLGQYDLQELVGEGGMGAVYRGTHHLLKRDVAIKVLEAGEISPQAASRFEREVQMTARLRHPNTIDIYDYGRTEDGTFFYVMEFVEGITLQELVDGFGPQPPERVIHLMLQICGSVGEAHQLGMIHRDIKPSNILLTARAGLYDMIKVLDFGLVKDVNHDTRELTQTDGITGTPMYMSPESVRDAATADQRSDLYSVGAVGYTLLTGRPAFDGDSSVDVCLKQLKEIPPRPDERLGQPLPEDLQNVLMSCLRKDPDERPRCAEDLELALRHCQHADAWTAAEAIHWWEVEFAAQGKIDLPATNPPGALTGKEVSTKTK